MGLAKVLQMTADQTKDKKEEKKDKKDNALNKAFHDFGDWITSPGGIVTILAIVGLVLYVNHKTEKK